MTFGSADSIDFSANAFREYLDRTFDAVFAHSRGTVVYVNAAFLGMMRATDPARYVGKNVLDMVVPEQRAAILERLQDPSAVSSGGVRELLCNRADGSQMWMEYSAVQTGRAEDQNLVHVVVARDTTERRKLEADLRDAEEQFRLLFENAAIGKALAGLDGRYIRANRPLLELVGYTQQEFCELSFSMLTHPDDRAQDWVIAKALLAGEIAQASRLKRYIHKDGHAIDVQVHVSVHRDTNGQAVGFISQVLDVTAQRRAERQLRESEERYRTLAANLPNGAVIMFDKDLRLLVVDGEKLMQSLGFDTKVVQGKLLHEVASTPQAYEKASAHYRAALEGKATFWQHTRDDRHFDCHTMPLRNDAGAITGGVTLIYEVTERQRLHDALKQSEARLSALIEYAGDAIWSVDLEGKLTAFNTIFAASLKMRHGVEARIGLKHLDAVPAAERAMSVPYLERALAGEPCSMEWSGTANDREAHVLVSFSPILADGRVAGAVISAKDITQRKENELAVRRKSRAVTLLADVASAANETMNSSAAIERCLRLIARFADWPVGHAYILRDGILYSWRTWYLRDSDQYQRFRIESERTNFARSVGLPGRVLESGKAQWMGNLGSNPNFLRATAAREHGLLSGFAFPFFVGDEMAGVFEFFSDRNEPPSAEITELMTHVAKQVSRVAERERHEEKIRALSLTDELTGLYNRRGFTTLASQQLRANRREQRLSALLFMDIDGLKLVNDELGHEGGDELIAAFGRMLHQAFREGDIAARIGGDEFVVFMTLNDPRTDTLLTRIERARLQANAERGDKPQLVASIGVAEIAPDSTDSLETLLSRADALMYENKRERRSNLP